MTRAEAFAQLDEAAKDMVRACQALGVLCAVVRSLDGEDEHSVRLICPDTLLVRPMLQAAVNELKKREEAHRC